MESKGSAEALQEDLKAELQKEKDPAKLERLAALLLGRLLRVTVAVANSGFQHGGDAGTSGRGGRRLRIECKKYSDTTPLSDRELRGEIDHALARDPALEAWVLVATREVGENIEQSLTEKGESVGVPVIILDWKPGVISAFAALCSTAPDLVEAIFSKTAGALAKALQPVSAEAVTRLRNELQEWHIGFDALRARSHAILQSIWSSPRASNSRIGQNAAGGAEPHKVRRSSVHDAIDTWWNGVAKEDALVVVLGRDGVGKTWATLDWLVAGGEDLPIVLVLPAPAATGLSSPTESAVKRLLADSLYEITAVRDRNHWLRRLDRLLKRPLEEGPALCVFFDGLNQEPGAPWLAVLQILQGDTFHGRVRVMISTRTHYYETRLSKLRGLIVRPQEVSVTPYDMSPGGEMDQMLAFEGLTRADLHPDLLELARTPRLFRLAVDLRDRVKDPRQVTVHRLMWEYGRDTLGVRAAGRSFSEEDWRAWLQEVACRYRDGVHQLSLKQLAQTTSRPDLSTSEVYARLSDIVDGRIATVDESGVVHLEPTIVAHALAVGVLTVLNGVTRPTFDSLTSELVRWLDPIAGFDQRSEILRAAVSILAESPGAAAAPVAGVLVTTWLQTQNIPESHRRELTGLAPSFPDALLDAVEHSEAGVYVSARKWAVSALRAIPRTDVRARSAILARARDWVLTVSRDVRNAKISDAHEASRQKRLLTRVGIDRSGPLEVLGVRLGFVDWHDGVLLETVPTILEGFSLGVALPVFEAAAITLAVRGRCEAWGGLDWLCLLNEVDPAETSTALRSLASEVEGRKPEAGIDPALPARVASLLLWLTADEADAARAVAIDSGLDRPFDYARDYLARPGLSLFALERRHAQDALDDRGVRLMVRIQRSHEMWLDPNFQAPTLFKQEILDAAREVEVGKLDRHSGMTIEDHAFEQMEPVLARCVPHVLADLVRRQIESFSTCPPASRYWRAIRATEHLLLADGSDAAAAARALRVSGREDTESNEEVVANRLLIQELHSRSAAQQVEAIIGANLKYITLELALVLRPLTPADADSLIARFAFGSPSQQRDLLLLLSHRPIGFSESAWEWLLGRAFGPAGELQTSAFRALGQSDAARFGRDLSNRNWTWSAEANHWVNEYGSDALIAATKDVPFDQVAPRLAPWLLLDAVRRRGVNPSEVRLAATILGRALVAEGLRAPDPGSTLSVDRDEAKSGLLRFSATPRESPEERSDDPAAALRAAMNTDAQLAAHNRAIETAANRIREARNSGAILYLAYITPQDVHPLLVYADDVVDTWLEGSDALSTDFERRVHLAEGIYLALCEALLEHDPPRGVALWRALNETLKTQFVGPAQVNELLHIPFRVQDSVAVNALRNELVELDRCHSDEDLLNIAIVATSNGKTEWLSAVIDADRASQLEWRRRRGMVLAGFTAGNTLPVADAWPEGEIRTAHQELRRRCARFRYLEACAEHWWRAYLAAPDSTDAYAAWVLFQRSADRRAFVWTVAGVQSLDESEPLPRLKWIHAELNDSELRRAMQKHEEQLGEQFLGQKIVDGVGPWYNKPE